METTPQALFLGFFFRHFSLSIFCKFFYGIFDKKIELQCFVALFFYYLVCVHSI